MLFHPKNKKAISVIWAILCVLIALSMILAFLPTLYY